MPEPSAFRLPRQELDFEIDRLMSVVIEDGVVRSTVQDLPIPDVDVGAFFRSACRKFKDRTALVGPCDENARAGAVFTFVFVFLSLFKASDASD